MSLRKGENTGLPTAAVRLRFGRRAGAGAGRVHACALLLSAGPGGGPAGAVRGPADLVHPGSPGRPADPVRYEGGSLADGYAVDTVAVDLASLDETVTSVVLVARGDGTPFGRLPGLWVDAWARGERVAHFDCSGATSETAYVLGECYRRAGGWRFRAVGQGYEGGFAELAGHYGLVGDAVPAFRAAAGVSDTGTPDAGAPQPGAPALPAPRRRTPRPTQPRPPRPPRPPG